jgi:hypothetical protein
MAGESLRCAFRVVFNYNVPIRSVSVSGTRDETVGILMNSYETNVSDGRK